MPGLWHTETLTCHALIPPATPEAVVVGGHVTDRVVAGALRVYTAATEVRSSASPTHWVQVRAVGVSDAA
jgi:hypothetical protein